MKTQHWLRFAFPAAAILLTSCGGGGGAGGSGTSAAPPVMSGPASLGHMVIAIPNAASSAARRVQGISPAAASVSIAVTGMSAQIADISATSPNCTTTSSGRTCTIPVSAPPGNDVFTVTVFDGPGATGHALGTGSARSLVVPGSPFSVNITLAGIIASLQFYINGNSCGSSGGPSGGSGAGPASGGGGCGSSSIGPPVGQSGSVIGTVAAQDASGNYIIGPFNSTVTITSSNPSITAVPSTLNGSGPVTFSYDGVATSAITLTASTGTTPAITTTKVVTPSTSVSYYPTPTINPVWINAGPDGKLYVVEFGTEGALAAGFVGGIGPSKIAQFDPAAKTFASEVTVGVGAIGMAWAPDGSIFEANQNDNPATIGHITGFSTYTPFTVPSSNFSGPRPIVLGPDGNMWFGEVRATGNPRFAKVGKFNPASPGTMTEYPLPTGSSVQSMAVGADHNLYATDRGLSAVDQITTSGTVTPFPLPGATPGSGNGFARFIAPGSDGNLWLTSIDYTQNPSGFGNGHLWKMSTAGAFTPITLPVVYSDPDQIHPGPAGTLFFIDLGLGGIGQVTTSGVVSDWPIFQNPCSATGLYPNDLALAPDGSIWFATQSCVQVPANETQGFIGHLQLAAGWTVFPMDDTLYLSPSSNVQSQVISMAESGDSSPFTIASSNPGVATVASTASSHTFVINAAGVGTTLLTITDAHGNSLTKNVVVSSATATVQSTGRRIR